MIDLFWLILVGIFVPSTPQPIPAEAMTPLQIYYQAVKPQSNHEQTYYQNQGYPSMGSSVYTFPTPNPAMFFRHAIAYKPEMHAPIYPIVSQEIENTELGQLERSSVSMANNRDAKPVTPVPELFDITAGTVNSTFLGKSELESTDFSIPVYRISNREGSTYPMQFSLPILPNLAPLQVSYQQSPLVMMPMQLYNYYKMPAMAPVPTNPFTSVTPSPIHDLKTLSAPAPETKNTITENPNSGPQKLSPVTETPNSTLEQEWEIPSKVSEKLSPVIEIEPIQPSTIADQIPVTPTPLSEIQNSASQIPTSVPKFLTADSSTTSVPEKYLSLDYSSLPTYFNKIYSSGATYASSYSDYIPIIKFEHNITANGYQVKFETENGIKSEEEGHLKLIDLSNENQVDKDARDSVKPSTTGVVHVKSGQVIWTSPECITFTLKYVADENGYRPTMKEFLDSGCNNEIEILGSAPPS